MLLSYLKNIRKLPQAVVVTLALTGVLSCGMAITNNNISLAVPAKGQIQQSQNTLPKSISQAILRNASKRSGVKIADLKITGVTATTFGNPCVFQFGEICTKEYRPIQGWAVIVQVKDQSWTYHVNKSGTQILLDPKVQVSGATQLPKNISDAVLNDAAKRSRLPVNAVKIAEATPKTFSNACVFGFGEICTQQYDPIEGWEVTVKVRGKSWKYHTDQSGSQIVLDPAVKV